MGGARTSSSRWRMALKASSSEPMWLRTACVSSYLATARSAALVHWSTAATSGACTCMYLPNTHAATTHAVADAMLAGADAPHQRQHSSNRPAVPC